MKKQVIIIIAVVFIIQIVLSFGITRLMEKKIAYIDVIQLVNDYHFKKDLELQADAALQQHKNSLDSINALLKVNAQDAQLLALSDTRQKEFAFHYQEINKDINTQVWSRLNPLISKYGEINNYDILIGANGMGTVLYGSKGNNVTDDLIKYVNDNYENGTR